MKTFHIVPPGLIISLMSKEFLDKLARICHPVTMTVELTHRCNHKCVYCYQSGPAKPDLSVEQWRAVIDQLEAAGTLNIIFSGGEPLVYRGFRELAEYAGAGRFAISLLSNGSLIDRETAEMLARLNTYAVRMSLHGAKPVTHDAMTGAAGSFTRTISAVEHLLDAGVQVQLSTTLTTLNFGELDGIGEIFERYGLKLMISPLVVPSQKATLLESLRLTSEEIETFFKWLTGRREVWAFERECGPESVLCGTGRTAGLIDAVGDVMPCSVLRMPAGNVLETPFAEIWSNSPLLARVRTMARREVEKCSTCDIFSDCVKCTGYGFIETGRYPEISREICRMARVMSNIAEKIRNRSAP